MRASALKIRLLAMVALLSLAAESALSQSAGENYVSHQVLLSGDGSRLSTSVQYYDGLGRPTTLVSDGVGGSGGPVCTIQSYDALGRVSRRWLPVSGLSALDLPAVSQAAGLASSTYNDTHAYSDVTYDVLDRVSSYSIPGDLWNNAGKKDVSRHSANQEGEVMRYGISLSSGDVSVEGHYAKGRLTCETNIDADGHSVSVYKDLEGRTVLERRGTDNDTYFVHDILGRLRYVLTPMYQETPDLELYAYEYRYDGRGNVTYRRLPGCEPTQYWYDGAGRLAWMQDGLLRDRGLYRFMLYDMHGRLCIQGLSTQCVNEPGSVNNLSRVSIGGIFGSEYSLDHPIGFSASSIEIANYYDRYGFVGNGLRNCMAGVSVTWRGNPAGQLTGSVQLASNGQTAYIVYWYDEKGREVARSTTLPGGLTERSYTEYTYTGNPVRVQESVLGSPLWTLSMETGYEYNQHNDKVSTQTSSICWNGRTLESATGYSYDDLGRLSAVTRPQGAGDLSWRYDLHGWPVSVTAGGFCENLYYASGFSRPWYNGNVSCVRWQHASTTENGTPLMRGYKYIYDDQDRLTEARYGEGIALSSNTGRYSELMFYDRNSNMSTLVRHGLLSGPADTYGAIDSVSFTRDGNRLTGVSEHAQPVVRTGMVGRSSNSTCTYNSIGALTSDSERGITGIEYDNWGTPRRVSFSNGNYILYLYTASGQRLRATYGTVSSVPARAAARAMRPPTRPAVSLDSVDYMFGGRLTLRNRELERLHFSEGYFCREVSSHSDSLHVRYFNRDHQGNVREVVDRAGTVLQVTDYYPYGAPFCDATSSIGASVQPYKYEGKELEAMHGLNLYDFLARWHNPADGAFTSMDPLCEKYYHISPYAYCAGNPVRYVDPTGEDFRLLFDFNERIITVYASYQVFKGAEKQFEKAAEFWNNKSFREKGITVNFRITSEAEDTGHLNTFSLANTKGEEKDGQSTSGSCSGKNIILYSNSGDDTAAHEIGHSLGIIHYDENSSSDAREHLMYYSQSERTNNKIDNAELYDIFNCAKNGIPNKDYDRTTGEVGFSGRCKTPSSVVKENLKLMKMAVKKYNKIQNQRR